MACIPLSYRCCTFWQNLFPLPIISQKVHKCCIAISMMEVFESCPYRLWSPDKSSSKSCSCEPKEFSSNQSSSNRPATMVANLITYAFNFDFNSSQMFGAMECLIVFFLRLFHSFSRVSSQTTSAIEWLVLNKSMAFKLFKKTNGHKNKLASSVDARISYPPPIPPIRATWSFFPVVKTTFIAYGRKKVPLIIRMVVMIIMIVMMVILMIMITKNIHISLVLRKMDQF